MIGNLLKLAGYALLAKEATDIVSTNQYYREKEQCRREAIYSVSSALFGVAVGVGIGVLFAPRSGKETREIVAESAGRQMDRLVETTKQFGETIGNREHGEEGGGQESGKESETK